MSKPFIRLSSMMALVFLSLQLGANAQSPTRETAAAAAARKADTLAKSASMHGPSVWPAATSKALRFASPQRSLGL
jgi:hypothetical protein